MATRNTNNDRQPWPLKWIAVAIVAFVVPYTYLTLHYRKPGPAYNPYEETKNRANTGRLLSAGYQRIAVGSERPADAARYVATIASRANATPAPGGLPPELTQALTDSPALPLTIDSVAAPSGAGAAEPYVIQFTCTLPDNKRAISGTLLYRKDDQLVIVPSFEKLSGGLVARSKESTVLVTVPAGSLKAGRYVVTLSGSKGARTWTLQVH